MPSLLLFFSCIPLLKQALRLVLSLLLVLPRWSSYNIFNEAMVAVLKIMDNNFSAEFQQSQAYKSLQKVVDDEADELERLRKVRQDARSILVLPSFFSFCSDILRSLFRAYVHRSVS